MLVQAQPYLYRSIEIKKYYLSAMAVRNLVFHFLSAVFAVLVVLSNWISYSVMVVLNPLKTRSTLACNISRKWKRVAQAGKRQILEYIQIVVNMILGLLLTKQLVSYHSFLIKTIVTISFQLHLISLNWVVDIPDYSAYLNDSESFKLVTVLLCLLFGYLGLSIQISFLLDLVSIFSYPFRAFRRICDKTQEGVISIKNAIIDILTTKRKYWLTCPYPDYLLTDTLKVVYICALPLIFSLIIFLKAYSILLSSLNFIAQTAINIGLNACQLSEEIPRIFSSVVGLEIENDRICLNKSSLNERCQYFISNLKQLEWTPVLSWKKIRQIFTISQKESVSYCEQKSFKYVSILRVYETFVNYLK